MSVNGRRDVLGVSKTAQKRRRVRHAKVVLLVLGIIITLALVSWGAHNEKIQIKDIEVEGVEFLNAQDVEGLLWQQMEGESFYLFPRTNSFLVDTNYFAEMLLENFPRIFALEVKRVDMKKLHIQIVERKSFIVWCAQRPSYIGGVRVSEKCLHADSGGYIFSTMVPTPDELLYIYGDYYLNKVASSSDEVATSTNTSIDWIGKNIMPESILVKTIEFADEVQRKDMSLWGVEIRDDDYFEILLESGAVIRFNPNEDLSGRVNDIVLAMKKKIAEGAKIELLEYIDARFPNKIIFRFKE